jgi:toxin-antitoxin system PIN domain toxin
VIIPDVNLLVYAYSKRSPWHETASRWWTTALNGTEGIGIATAVALGFVRLMSNAKVVDKPVRPEVLLRTVESWLDLPRVRLIGPGFRHFEAMAELFAQSSAQFDLSTDIHIAALAMEYGAVVHSNDGDLGRFPSVRVLNPLAGQ